MYSGNNKIKNNLQHICLRGTDMLFLCPGLNKKAKYSRIKQEKRRMVL